MVGKYEKKSSTRKVGGKKSSTRKHEKNVVSIAYYYLIFFTGENVLQSPEENVLQSAEEARSFLRRSSGEYAINYVLFMEECCVKDGGCRKEEILEHCFT